jgi:RimJ/RimL family protein N-acetyltransferase
VTLTLRPATLDDAERLHAWRNETETRRQSIDGAPIPFGQHVEWLRRQLTRADVRLYVAELESEPVGQVRLDRTAAGAGEISLGLAPEARGRGLGTELIRAGTQAGLAELGLARIDAVVKPGNTPSLAAFARAGYARTDELERDGVALVGFSFRA